MMKVYLLLLFGLLVCDNWVNAGKWCSNPVPGIPHMVSGVDITELNLFNSDVKSNGFRGSVIDLTCDQNKKWNSPWIPGMTFDIPDQVEHLDSVPRGLNKMETLVIQNRKQLEKKYRHQARKLKHSSGCALTNSFYQEAANLINSNTFIAQSSAFVSTVAVDFQLFFNLNAGDSFLYHLEKLPDNYEKNAEDYEEFVELYGTHYIESAILGGVFMHEIEVNERFNSSDNNTLTELKRLLNENVSGYLSLPVNGTTRRATSVIKYFGGEVNLVDPTKEEIRRWQFEMVPRNPWPYSVVLRPLWRLVPNIALRAQLKRAIQQRIAKASLLQSKGLLQILEEINAPPSEKGLFQAKELLDQVEHCLKQPFADENEAKSIQNNVFKLYDKYKIQ